jgi:hypothetical protein
MLLAINDKGSNIGFNERFHAHSTVGSGGSLAIWGLVGNKVGPPTRYYADFGAAYSSQNDPTTTQPKAIDQVPPNYLARYTIQ